MIPLNELRVGIYLNIFDPNKVGLNPVVIDNQRLIALITGEETSYHPIPLTPEILEKAGFEKGLNSIIHRRQDYTLESFGTICIYNEEMQYHCNGRLIVLKSLHQLQNLYFALTQTELTIQL